jgi:hypothetical protein
MSDEIVLIQSHHDSTTSGAVEDASGAAEVMALARYFGQFPKDARPRTVMFATMDTHFTDLPCRHRWWTSSRAAAASRRTATTS